MRWDTASFDCAHPTKLPGRCLAVGLVPAGRRTLACSAHGLAWWRPESGNTERPLEEDLLHCSPQQSYGNKAFIVMAESLDE